MRYIYPVIFIILLSFLGCHLSNKKVTFSTIKFNCEYTSNPISEEQPYFDTLQVFIKRDKPDLISFKGTVFTNECTKRIELQGYEFIPLNFYEDSILIPFSPIALKKTSFNFLGSSYYIYKNDTLEEDKNMVSWYQLKNMGSGHIFYLFSLQLQNHLNAYQSEIIGFDLLKRIDNISAGLPVILIGDFYKSNDTIKELITFNWNNTFQLKEVKTINRNSDFLVNDFLVIKDSFTRRSNDSLINNVVLKFSINSNRIIKNSTGENIPE